MRAIQYESYGGPEVLKRVEVAEPHAAANQIRVVVKAVGINPIDWKFRQGMIGGDLPRRTGIEVAGVVDEIGEGVDDITLGERVFGPVAGGDGAADFALLENYAPVPQSLDFAGAAALPVAVETATRTLDLLGVSGGQTVLVNGAAGAVGIATVQLARERGANVIGTASARNHDYVRSFGAEATTYGDGLVERVREIAPDGVDRAIDDAGGGALPALVELAGGAEHVVTIADYQGAEETGVRMTGGAGSERAWHALAHVAELIDAGRFSLPVAQTFALEQIAEAHRLSESRHVRGKLVLLVD
ncbi:MAG TPA: NADP-dependent oxidoreductase [Solirubrobacteraceae bacterium]|nr:NADP-dependent oxidoreductase [Solirubrobacteraceae bacterium]